MVWNVLSLALNAEEIHVATCLGMRRSGLWFRRIVDA
jgi:hypothetical protein